MSYGKLYGRQVFKADVEGTQYTFTCYGQNTNYGFRHICTYGLNNTTNARYIKSDIVSKASYYNRTWERFTYETVLNSGIKAIAPNKKVEEKLHAILIDYKANEEHEKAEEFITNFQNTYNSLNQNSKDSIKRIVDNLPNGMITSEEQAKSISTYASILSILQ